MRSSEISTRAGRGERMDAWKLAEVRGHLYGLLLKVDVLAAGGTDMEIIQGVRNYLPILVVLSDTCHENTLSCVTHSA